MKYLILTYFFILSLGARNPISSKRFEQLSGGTKSRDAKTLWDRKYSKNSYVYGKNPEKFLVENYQYIPQGAKVLDVGIGEGRHAVFLAQKGFKVTGIDISSVALRKSKKLAKEYGVRFTTVRGDITTHNFKDGEFDAIVNFYYVDRELRKRLIKMLKPGGVLIFEAYTFNQKKLEEYKRYNDDYLLQPGELLDYFPSLKILKYEEPLHESRYRASAIFQKPVNS